MQVVDRLVASSLPRRFIHARFFFQQLAWSKSTNIKLHQVCFSHFNLKQPGKFTTCIKSVLSSNTQNTYFLIFRYRNSFAVFQFALTIINDDLVISRCRFFHGNNLRSRWQSGRYQRLNFVVNRIFIIVWGLTAIIVALTFPISPQILVYWNDAAPFCSISRGWSLRIK